MSHLELLADMFQFLCGWVWILESNANPGCCFGLGLFHNPLAGVVRLFPKSQSWYFLRPSLVSQAVMRPQVLFLGIFGHFGSFQHQSQFGHSSSSNESISPFSPVVVHCFSPSASWEMSVVCPPGNRCAHIKKHQAVWCCSADDLICYAPGLLILSFG